MTILSAIGEIQRFPSVKKIVGYTGLGAGVDDSRQKHNEKGLTKAGRTAALASGAKRELRWALIEAAWQAIRSNPRLRAEYDQLCQRKHPN